MPIRRALTFGWAVVRGLAPRAVAPLDGSWIALIALVVGFVGGEIAQSFFAPDSPWPTWIRIAGVALAVALSAFREWDRWAPHSPPTLSIEAYFWPGGGLSLHVTNGDADGVFKASVTNVSGPNGPLPYPSDHPFPWTLVWGDQQTTEYQLIRGETAIVPVVGIDLTTDRWQIVGPKGPHEMQLAFQPEIVIHARIARIQPASGFGERSVLVRFPPASTGSPPQPHTDADAEPALGFGRALDATVTMTDALQAQITRGPGNVGIDEVNWRTEGQRDKLVHLDRKPRAIRIFLPRDQIVTTVPAEVPVGLGKVIVTRFFEGGFMIDEVGTIGDVVRAQPYFDDD